MWLLPFLWFYSTPSSATDPGVPPRHSDPGECRGVLSSLHERIHCTHRQTVISCGTIVYDFVKYTRIDITESRGYQ